MSKVIYWIAGSKHLSKKNYLLEYETMKQLEEIRKMYPEWQFPNMEAHEIAPKKHKYAICVFVINEGEKVRKQIKNMEQFADRIDILIADGGSTDGSLDLPYLKKHKVRALLTKKGPGKLSAQMRMAFAWALAEGYEGTVVVDGNGKDDITAIPAFIGKLEEGYDHVQGSRFIPGGKAVNTPLERHIAVKLLHSPLISIAARHRHTDTTNGFRAYSKKLLTDEDLAIFRDVFATYELHYYLAIESARSKKGYKLTEVPVTRTYPKNVKTPTKISPIKGNLHVMGVLVKATLRKYKP
jgi:dolichol-phosphate mannosyltransferase